MRRQSEEGGVRVGGKDSSGGWMMGRLREETG